MLVLKDPAVSSSELEYARKAIEKGELIIVPTDTVYGIAASASNEEAVERLYALKGREKQKATAVIFSSVPQLKEAFKDTDISIRALWAVSALLPGPWTLIVNNPSNKWPWLTAGVKGAPIGIRVPAGAVSLPPLAASSANLSGEKTVTKISELPETVMKGVACAIDRGSLDTCGDPVASTILDLTEWEKNLGPVKVIRDEASRAAVAIAALTDAPHYQD